MRGVVVGAIVLGCVVGCGGEPMPPPEPSAVARFAPSSGPMDFGAVPFPSDLYLDADGHAALASLPARPSSAERTEDLLAAVARQRGFCTTCGTHFFVDGALDPTSVPSEVGAATDPIVMIDADPASPDRGAVIPLSTQLRTSAGLISVRPALGITLHRSRRYVIALTSAIRAADGTALAASEDFGHAREGRGEARVAEHVRTALDELERAGVDPERVVAVASFTTLDPTERPLALRALVRSAPRPVASVDRVYPSETMSLDELLGVPATGGFGLAEPEAGGAAGERGLLHATTHRIVIGRFTAPRFVTGSGTDIGVLEHDAEGQPTITGEESIPFLLVIPRDADVTALPVAILGHGSPRTMEDGLALADTLGASGIAVLAYDAYQHGGRSPSAVDLRTVRGAAGEDGIMEHDGATIAFRMFALQDAPTGMDAAVSYIEAGNTQIAADILSAVRFAVEGDLSAIADADPTLAGLAFDPDRVAYIGNSFGTQLATVAAIAEPDLDVLVLNVPGGGLVQSLVGAGRARFALEATIVPLYGMRGIDDVARKLLFEPMMDLVGWVVQGTDNQALAPYIYREPLVAGPRPDLLVQIAELDDFLPVWGAQSMFAAIGGARIGPFDSVSSVPEATLPISANLTTPAGEVTSVAHLYEGASHVMLGYDGDVVFEEPLEPPFRPLATPRPIENPVDAVHLEIRAFVTSRLRDGRARLD